MAPASSEHTLPRDGTVVACPLCGAQGGSAVASFAYDEIWRRLASDWGASFEPAVIERHTPRGETELVECGGCGLQYFSPSRPGDADFYDQVTRARYYEGDRWEFGVVAGLVRPGEDVVDVGCGRGAFLERMRGHAGRAVGVDHNPSAIEALRAAGIEAHAADFADFAAREGRAFDAVCGFQILEHLPRAGDLIGAAVECLRPGGRIYVSVPNRRRFGRAPLEPFDCPPHHISRWDPRQFELLAERFGLELGPLRFEQPDLDTVRLDLQRRVSGRAAAVVGARAGGFAARAAGRLLTGPRRHARAAAAERYSRRGLYAHTMLAELRVPRG
jgi:SAM-dependent methyltransferase